jgi:hypothetical protein
MRIVLACCLILISGTAAIAENTAKTFIEACKTSSVDDYRKYPMGECAGVVTTMMALGPYLLQDMKFCPGHAPPIVGMGVMNQYAKAHPELLKSDGPDGDRLFLLLSAFREKWPCK